MTVSLSMISFECYCFSSKQSLMDIFLTCLKTLEDDDFWMIFEWYTSKNGVYKFYQHDFIEKNCILAKSKTLRAKNFYFVVPSVHAHKL